MREDLDKVIAKFNEPETFNTEMQKLSDLENKLMKKYTGNTLLRTETIVKTISLFLYQTLLLLVED